MCLPRLLAEMLLCGLLLRHEIALGDHACGLSPTVRLVVCPLGGHHSWIHVGGLLGHVVGGRIVLRHPN